MAEQLPAAKIIKCFSGLNDIKILETLMSFHVAPSAAVFNHVISGDKELYVADNEIADAEDELYMTYEGEGESARYGRIRIAKRQIEAAKTKPAHGHKSNYCNPILLAWTHAAVTKFPWLIAECDRPLYIERAYRFIAASYTDLWIIVERGPVIRSTNDASEQATLRDCAIFKWKERNCDLLGYEIVRYGASGDFAGIKRFVNIEFMPDDIYQDKIHATLSKYIPDYVFSESESSEDRTAD